MTAWSPPRLRAISRAMMANWNISWKEAPTPMPMERVALMPWGPVTFWTASSRANLFWR